MEEEPDEAGRRSLGNPMLWGFLSTLLLGLFGYFGLLLGAWPLLWLPMLAPLFAFAYMRGRLHDSKGFDRFLVGYGLCLTTFVVVGILLLAALT